MRERQIRSWKRAYDPNFDPENPTTPPREDLTTQQKNWIVRAWIWMFGTLPNAVPVYNERRGFFHTPAVKSQIHHIKPIGEMTRLDGNDGYNYPENLAPVSALNHVGTGANEDDFVIHEDTQQAQKNYGKFRRGEIKENPYAAMGREGKKKTDKGEIYHNSDYDRYLEEQARLVAEAYARNHPTDKFPPNAKHRK